MLAHFLGVRVIVRRAEPQAAGYRVELVQRDSRWLIVLNEVTLDLPLPIAADAALADGR